jgi:hypothetical protein
MDKSNIIFRLIEERDNRAISELIRSVFREFKIDKPGTYISIRQPITCLSFSVFRVQNTGLPKKMVLLSEDVVFTRHQDYQKAAQSLLSYTFLHLTGEKVSDGSLWK